MKIVITWDVLTWGHVLTFVAFYWLGGGQFPAFRGRVLQISRSLEVLQTESRVLTVRTNAGQPEEERSLRARKHAP